MTLIFLGLFVLLMVLVVKAALHQPHILLKSAIHILGGIVGLWLMDVFLSVLGLEIPINFFTITLVGFLGFPGVIALSALQLLGV